MKNSKRNGKILPFLKQVRCYSLPGFFRYLYLKIVGKSILVTGSCRGCGMCCRRISLEGRNGWLRSEKTFHETVTNYPEYGRFVIIGRDTQGFLLFSCSWSTPQGTCIDYENRLGLCQKFPESSLVFAGGRLPSTCGYKFDEVVPFKKVLHTAVRRQK
ncbi:MAG: hypothetical protein KJ630_24570 [Proteobacteria bacterium]|nr:hypothetical protein [Pseudomonadota bacterium]